ncbi:MAG: peptidase M24 [Candidatus Kapaibacterium sp.]|nr:MAG: peptidase M24 [Candidatus Kapabacteria bacterium]
MLSIQHAQDLLAQAHLDGWLLYDFRGSNPIARRLLELNSTAHLTRRFALWIPCAGEPILAVSSLDAHIFEPLPYPRRLYASRYQWQHALHDMLTGARKIAVEYSPLGELPTVSFLDAGTAEFLRSLGLELVSSADLVQYLEAVWSQEQIQDNLVTASKLRSIMMASIEQARWMARERRGSEYDLQQFILNAFAAESLRTDHWPIVAIGPNTASPHYEPTPGSAAPIVGNALLMLDMWAKSMWDNATYADITWTVWLGTTPPDEVRHVADLVIAARDAALDKVRKHFASRAPVHGYQVDDAARDVITAAGYGEYFIHRTGHSIGTEVHGYGANMDNYETCDTRQILPGTSFSIEPGIYLPGRFGVRSECDVVIDHNGAVLIPSEPLQHELIVLEV